MDKIDRKILAVLQGNARASLQDIGQAVGLSASPCWTRIKRMEDEGVIEGYTVRVADEHERAQIRAHILIAVMPRRMASVVAALREMPEVRTLHSVSGPYDLVALGVTPTVAQMDELTDRIGAIDGVERTTSSIILSAKFER